MTTAAGLIIGDEILTGKVRDTNGPVLIDLLRDLGVTLDRLVYIGDELESIAGEVAACAGRYDAVITSGGVGPTHDDVTMAGIAAAFGVEVVRHPDLEAMIRAWWGDRFTEAALRMAEMPDGSRLLYSGDGLIPLVVFRNVYILPGIPRLFQAKLGALRSELEGQPTTVRSVYLRSDESQIAALLGQAAEEFRAVKIGSYPRSEDEDHRLWITVEAGDLATVRAAVERILELLPDGDVVRVDDL
jgi:molybdenum cofactor synthesis domain-containing protein